MKLLLNFLITIVFGFSFSVNDVISDSDKLNSDNDLEIQKIEEKRIRSNIQQEIEGVTHISSNYKLRKEISNLIFNYDSKSVKYDLKNRPQGTLNDTGPVIVNVSMYIQNVDKISDTDMELTVRFILRESWIDNRLAYSDAKESQITNLNSKFILLTEDEANKIWTPDLYFSNEKEGLVHAVRKPISYTRVYPNGRVLESTKLSVKLSCPMSFLKFPLDSQNCHIRISPFGWLKGEVELVWNHTCPVDLRQNNTQLAYYTISPFDCHADLAQNVTNRTSTGEYSSLIVWLRFTRKFGIYFIQLYLPSTLLVVMSWTPFWIDPEEGKDSRFAIGIGIILCLITQTYVSTKDSPPTAYIKGSDLWIGFCQFLVFMAFLEYMYANCLIQRGSLFSPKKLIRFFRFGCKKGSLDIEDPVNSKEDSFPEERFAKWVDRSSRIVFPCVFILFNCVYWPIMASSD